MQMSFGSFMTSLGNTAADLTGAGLVSRLATGKGLVTELGSGPPKVDPKSGQIGGDPNFVTDQFGNLIKAGDAAQTRQGAQINTAGVDPFMAGAGGALGSAEGSAAQLGNVGGSIYGTGNTLAGYAGQATPGSGLEGQAGHGLLALGGAQQGPSASVLAMQNANAQALQSNQALAASARGSNAGLALQAASANQGNVNTALTQQVGQQRAAEDLAYKQQQANAYTGAANVFSNQFGEQTGATTAAGNAYGNAGNAYGAQGGLYGSIAGQNAGLANINAGIATQNASNQQQQQQLNDAFQQTNQSQGYGLQTTQAQNNLGIANTNMQADAAGRAAMLNAFSSAAGTAAKVSDVRAKKDIAPAAGRVADAFRSADRDAAFVRGAPVAYPDAFMAQPAAARYADAAPAPAASFPDAPPYSYQYKAPDAPGAEPGMQYGPMAQDLEQTPAGASVVGTDKKGKKFVDPGRLSMLTASEVSQHRKELDYLKSRIDASEQPYMAPPSPHQRQRDYMASQMARYTASQGDAVPTGFERPSPATPQRNQRQLDRAWAAVTPPPAPTYVPSQPMPWAPPAQADPFMVR